jgi:ATP-dependent DNA helicase RecG
MNQFSQGATDLLVATTVIEVGVNVPNATLMIIENPERLGLSQLHQLRGRVGRGDKQSHCVLLYQTPLSNHSKERLKVMRDTNNGFIIAEKDLELRGSGELLGTRQTGMKQFKVACLKRDKHLFDDIGAIANKLCRKKPDNIPALIQRWLGNSWHYLKS